MPGKPLPRRVYNDVRVAVRLHDSQVRVRVQPMHLGPVARVDEAGDLRGQPVVQRWLAALLAPGADVGRILDWERSALGEMLHECKVKRLVRSL